MKIIDTRAYVSAVRELTEEGRTVSFRIEGSSMVPFLVHERDVVLIEKPKRPLKRGDIVFYQRRDGRFVLHRIFRIRPEGFYLVGDAQTVIEGPLQREQIFALVTGARRKGKKIGPGGVCWEFFRCIWIRLVPLRPVLMKLYSAVR